MVVFVIQTYNTSGRLFEKIKYSIRLVVCHLVQDGQDMHYTSRGTKSFSLSGPIMRLSPVFMHDELNDAQQNEFICFCPKVILGFECMKYINGQ